MVHPSLFIQIPNVCFLPNARFEIAIFVLIFLNMLTMGIEHYDQPHAVFFILEVSNAFFTTVFGLGKCWRTDKRMVVCISCLYSMVLLHPIFGSVLLVFCNRSSAID